MGPCATVNTAPETVIKQNTDPLLFQVVGLKILGVEAKLDIVIPLRQSDIFAEDSRKVGRYDTLALQVHSERSGVTVNVLSEDRTQRTRDLKQKISLLQPRGRWTPSFNFRTAG